MERRHQLSINRIQFCIMWSLLIGTLLLCFSCKKAKFKKAENSLEGNWNVESAYIAYGQRMDLGTQTDSSFTEENVGSFEFEEDKTGNHNFVLRGENYNIDNFSWELEERDIGGFTNAKGFNIVIDEITYRLTFGDGTSDAHKNATEMELFFETTDIGEYFSYQLSLTKRE